ncbi:MAG: adenosine monophosphate-protein transferase [Candidatus Diapherotrites archaeon]|nr:adenosine monophosphate-protein transferase [Candidatus Diapherotrites archaeon]
MVLLEMLIIERKNEEMYEVIVGQANFTIKTIDDLYDAVYSAVPSAEFGAAMNEAKPQLTRVVGTDENLKAEASKLCNEIAAGHVFVIYIKKAFPIHILNAVKSLPTVCSIFLATSNPFQVIVGKTDLGHAVLGAVDGASATAIETGQQKNERRELKERFGFVPK